MFSATTCPQLSIPNGEIPNGDYSCTEGLRNSYDYGTKCTFTCQKPDYELVGDEILTCNCDAASANKKWDHPVPTCSGNNLIYSQLRLIRNSVVSGRFLSGPFSLQIGRN